MQFLGRQFSSQSTHEVVRFNSTRPRVRIACPCDRAGLLESRVSCHHPYTPHSCSLSAPKFVSRSIWPIANPRGLGSVRLAWEP